MPPESVRVCDQCDFEMDNNELFRNLKQVEDHSAKQAELQMEKTITFTEYRDRMVEEQQSEKEHLNAEFSRKSESKAQLEKVF